MLANRRVMSALLGMAMLAIPVAAAAHPIEHYRNRFAMPAYDRAYRPAVRAPMRFASPREAAFDRRWLAPVAPVAPMMPVRDYYRAGCAMAPAAIYNPYTPAYNSYSDAYDPGYMPPPAYDYAMPNQGAPIGGRLANMIRQRDSAAYQYRMALQRGNRDRARHLRNDIAQLNKNIASARMRRGIGPAYGSFNSPMASTLGNQYGYGNGYGNGNSNLDALVGPLLGNYIH